MRNDWFTVDKEGLAKLIADRGKIFVIHELLQNGWDEDGVTTVEVTLTPIAGRPAATLTVVDDAPEGFKDLRHAWTMFAESPKKDDAEKRGRFDLGEKLVLSLCRHARIVTTKGTVSFNADGTRRVTGSIKLVRGTQFEAEIAITREEIEEIDRKIGLLIPPEQIKTLYNGRELTGRPMVTSFEASLPTPLADESGVIRNRIRKTRVTVYQPREGERAMIYEMGVPIVESNDAFHVDVHQKVVLSTDRDNVTPSYLRTLRVEVVNHTSHLMTPERAASTEVQEATSDPRAAPAAVDRMLTQRFGEKRYIYDPSDTEANKRLVAEGYTPIMGGSLNADQWGNVRKDNLARPAGVISPSPKCYEEVGRPENVVPECEWTEGIKRQVKWIKRYAQALELGAISVKIVREPIVFWLANYGPGSLTLNLSKLGHKGFDRFPANLQKVIDLMIHEFGHHYERDHLSEKYYHALTDLGARSTMLALKAPELFTSA